MDFGALAGDDIDENGAAGILGLVGVDDLHGERESVFDFADVVVGIEGPDGDDSRAPSTGVSLSTI